MSEALLAADMLAAAPGRLGGVWLRGAGPQRDAVLSRLKHGFAGRPVRRLPVHIDEERLCGGLDVAASLASGERVEQAGLLHEVSGGLLIVPMAERLDAMVAGRIAQAMDAGAGFALALLDDGGDDETPPVSLTERVAFWCELQDPSRACPGRGTSREADGGGADKRPPQDSGPGNSGHDPSTTGLRPAVPLPESSSGGTENCGSLAQMSVALGIDSARALLFAMRAQDPDIALKLILAPRATRIPQQAEEQPPPSGEDEPPPGDSDSDTGQDRHTPDQLDDLVLAAALAAIPADVLARIGEGRAARRSTGSGGAGRKRASRLRGRPLGARPGLPRGGARLALIDTLRAAVPWQEIRRRQEGPLAPKRLRIRKGDLRVRRFEERAEALTIFAVDASGSSALARLAEAKGAVELMLAQSYVKRAQVALIAFRGAGAQLLLPPTRSLTRAKKVLGELPGGGGTPLAAGLVAAAELAEAQAQRGRTPFVALLTDGKANIGRDGEPGRVQAGADALAAARRLAASGTQGVVIDISARPQNEAVAIAAAMRARYLALPRADARGVERAVSALQFGNGT